MQQGLKITRYYGLCKKYRIMEQLNKTRSKDTAAVFKDPMYIQLKHITDTSKLKCVQSLNSPLQNQGRRVQEAFGWQF